MTIRLRPRANPKILFYARALARELLPAPVCRALLKRRLTQASGFDTEALNARLDYYARLPQTVAPLSTLQTAGKIARKFSLYYFDLRQHTRYFDPQLKLAHLFGDITHVPDEPTIVKSRPISVGDTNSVLMQLDKNRHFYFPDDQLAFSAKRPMAVWRGQINNERRAELVRSFAGHPLCDVGAVGRIRKDLIEKPFMPVHDQLAYRFIISIEGHDVATNLKWGMASNSLCMSPKLKYETWFMEGRLQEGVHFVGLKDDFSDLEDKIIYYNQHIDEAQAIIRNANAWVDEFRDTKREDLLSLMVLQRYFQRTGQL